MHGWITNDARLLFALCVLGIAGVRIVGRLAG